MDGVNVVIREYIVMTWLSGDARGFDDDTDLQKVGVLDSFSILALIGFLESRFRTHLETSDMSTDAFRSVRGLTDLVQGKLARSA